MPTPLVKRPWLYYLYRFLFPCFIPLLLFRLWIKSQKYPAYGERLKERLGYAPQSYHAKTLWVHAVSLGEVIAATPLVQAFLKQRPHTPIVFTTSTPTGAQQVYKTFSHHPLVKHAYFPYDSTRCLQRFLNRINPEMLIVLETELWPRLFEILGQRGTPLFLVNARLSDKAYPKYRLIRSLLAYTFQWVTAAFAQSELNRERFIHLGMPSDKIRSMSNLKLAVSNSAISSKQLEEAEAFLKRGHYELSDFVWVAASTHEGEEELIIEAFKQAQASIPALRLILIPRHPERFSAVEKQIDKTGLPFLRRSQTHEHNPKATVYLIDTLGEVPLFLHLSQVAFIGGSLIPVGGHNLVEPALMGLPILTGPHNQNSQAIFESLNAMGMVHVIQTAEEMASKLRQYYENPELRTAYREKGRQLVEQSQGIAESLQTQIMAALSR